MSGTPSRVFDALDAEWALVCAGPGKAATVHNWLQDGGVFSDQEAVVGLEDVLPELERRDRAYGRAHSDRWLYALLCEAVGEGAGAQLAARVVVQAMLPGAVRLTKRLRAGRDFDETGQVVTSCLYRVVRTYPLARRHRVAANLVLETLHWASRELAAEAASGGVSWQRARVIVAEVRAGARVSAEQAARFGVPASSTGACSAGPSLSCRYRTDFRVSSAGDGGVG